MPVHQQHTSHPQTQELLQPLVRQQSCCCHSWLFTSLWLIVTLSHRPQSPPLIVADCNRLATLTEESVQKKKKAEKVYFYLRQNKLKKQIWTKFSASPDLERLLTKTKKELRQSPSVKPLLGPQFWLISTQLALLGVCQNTN
jgi:hypothetical protein